MIRFIAVLALLVAPLTASAQCGGTDMITAMSGTDRARLTQRAQAAPYPEGLLWQATKGDTQITLFGTYHFEHERTGAHLDTLKPLIEQADLVYLEVSNDDQKQLQRDMSLDPSIMFITQGPTLPDLLGEEDWKRLSHEMRERSIPGFMAAKFKPFWAAMMLGIGPCESRNSLAEQNGIDKQVGDYAASIGNPSRSLEDFRTLLTLFDAYPQEDQLDMIRLFFAWPGNPDDMAYTLRQRYLSQEVALVWEYSRLISLEFGGESAAEDFALLEQQLLIGRNQGWIEVLMDEIPGKTALIAVGAAHLPGEFGVLNLLAQKGFTITRLPFEG